jgi:sterol desaturase/sphingolipid hydroxylase (fatty acid hydroxylase superfamily)
MGNIGAGICTVVGVFIGYGIVSLVRGAIGFDASLAGAIGIPAPAEAGPATLLLLSLPVLLLADLFIYVYHRTAHASGNSFRWRMHSIHHSIPHFSLALGARAHPIETLTTYALCGAAGGVLGVGLPASFCAGIFVLCVMSPHHVNCDNELGPLSRLFVTTEAHRWHHHIDHRDSGNYGLLFSFWDRWLGTHHEPERFSGRLGVDAFVDGPPGTIIGRFLLPLQSRWALGTAGSETKGEQEPTD